MRVPDQSVQSAAASRGARRAGRPGCRRVHRNNGCLLESNDGGRTSQVNANFGARLSVVGVTYDEQCAHVRLAFQGNEFTLVSADS